MLDKEKDVNAIKKKLNGFFLEGMRVNRETKSERKDLREFYTNKESKDYFKMATDDETRRSLFRSGVVSSNIDLRTSMLTEKRPRFFLNPVLKEDYVQTFMDAMDLAGEDQKYVWIAPELEKVRGSLESFINNVIDFSVESWWEKAAFDVTIEILTKNAFIDGRAWLRWRFIDNDIVADVLFEEDILVDPDAKRPEDRRYVMYKRKESVETIMEEYGVDVVGDPSISIPFEYISTEGEYKEAKVWLVEAYLKDKIYLFVTGQPEGGITILQEQDNTYGCIPIIDFIPDHIEETEGIPYSRGLVPLQVMDDMTVQQGFWNFRMVGNSKIVYEPETLLFPDRLSNEIGQKIPVRDASGVQYIPGTSTINEAMILHANVQQMARDKTGMHEVSEGRTRGRIESSKAFVVVDDIIQRRLRPALRSLEETLRKAFGIWGKMFLQVHSKDTPIRFGRNLRSVKKLPFALKALIEDFDVFICKDTELPKDEQSMANLMMTLSQATAEDGLPYIPREVLLDYLGLENKDEIMAKFDSMKALKDQLNQAMQMMQKQQLMIDEMQSNFDKVIEQNQKLEAEKNSKIMDTQGKIEVERAKREGINTTEFIRNEMKKERDAMILTLKAELERRLPTTEGSIAKPDVTGITKPITPEGATGEGAGEGAGEGTGEGTGEPEQVELPLVPDEEIEDLV